MNLNLQQTPGNKIQAKTISKQQSEKNEETQKIRIAKIRASCFPLIRENKIGFQGHFKLYNDMLPNNRLTKHRKSTTGQPNQ